LERKKPVIVAGRERKNVTLHIEEKEGSMSTVSNRERTRSKLQLKAKGAECEAGYYAKTQQQALFQEEVTGGD